VDYRALGRRIRDERKARGWTQSMLAKLAYISTSFLGHMERGTRKASLETVVSIANVLEVSLDNLFVDSLSPPKQPNPSSEYEIVNTRKIKLLRQKLHQIDRFLDEWVE
jgi:transcriptional regulator with XRE-family HTH domain